MKIASNDALEDRIDIFWTRRSLNRQHMLSLRILSWKTIVVTFRKVCHFIGRRRKLCIKLLIQERTMIYLVTLLFLCSRVTWSIMSFNFRMKSLFKYVFFSLVCKPRESSRLIASRKFFYILQLEKSESIKTDQELNYGPIKIKLAS